jgi:hypothetical protein
MIGLKEIIGSFAVILVLTACESVPPKVSCNFDQSAFTSEIKQDFKADSVKMYSQILQEEIYFPKLKSIVIEIYNGTTPILDFKKIDDTLYYGYNVEIEHKLKEYGEKYAERISQNCNMSKFNDIMIIFEKSNKKGEFSKTFINHYEINCNN